VYDCGILARFLGTFGATVGTANAAKKILKYLSGTRRRGLRYSPKREKDFCERYSRLIAEQCENSDFGNCSRSASEFSAKVFAFGDASFATCPLTLKSQTGVCIYYRGVLIHYKSMRQTINTFSTCASEFVACADTHTFLETIEPQLRLFDPPEIGHPQFLFSVFCDNQSAIRIARGDVLTNASKHLKLRHIRVSQKNKQLFFCDTHSMQADAFTKSLGEAIFGMMVFLEEA
jgi:hypothetical protein